MDKSDLELIIAFENGSQEALKTLISRHIKRVYAFAYRMTGNPEDASDITQEAFIKAWKNLGKYDRNKKFISWLLAIARNGAFDWFKKKKAITFSALEENLGGEEDVSIEDSLPDLGPLQDELFEKQESARAVEQALSKLPLNFREVVVLHIYDELTFQEIADILKKPLNTVKSLYRRGLLFLKKIIEDEAAAPKVPFQS